MIDAPLKGLFAVCVAVVNIAGCGVDEMPRPRVDGLSRRRRLVRAFAAARSLGF